ncbi:MAG: cytochrome oxidase small assembly protein [Burkholderiales bacterium]
MEQTPQQRTSNLRTALVLFSVALTFFMGVIIKYYVLR